MHLTFVELLLVVLIWFIVWSFRFYQLFNEYIEKRRCCMAANDTNLHKRPNATEINVSIIGQPVTTYFTNSNVKIWKQILQESRNILIYSRSKRFWNTLYWKRNIINFHNQKPNMRYFQRNTNKPCRIDLFKLKTRNYNKQN